METTEFTKFSVEVSDREKITCEFPTQDVSVEDVCQAFRTMMVGMTFTDETAGRMIASYLGEHYGELFNIIDIDE